MLRNKTIPLFVISLLILLTSCSTKKKVYRSPATNSNVGYHPITDASGAANVKWSASKMDNYAQILGVNTYVLSRNMSLYSFIDDWMGSPHAMGGQSKTGVDCSGFINILYRQIYGKDLPRSSREMADIVKRKYDNQLKEGDLVFFSFGGGKVDHVGLYLHNNKFIHVSTRKGVIISDIKDPWYYKYLTRCGTPKV